MKKLALLLLFLPLVVWGQQSYEIFSPDSNIRLVINCKQDSPLVYSVYHKGTPIVEEGRLAITFRWSGGNVIPRQGTERFAAQAIDCFDVRTDSWDETLSAPFYKRGEVRNQYNYIHFDWMFQSLTFRVYNEGVAYHWGSCFHDMMPVYVLDEENSFRFPEGSKVWASYSQRGFASSHENTYLHEYINDMDTSKLAYAPLLVALPSGKKVVLTESNLRNYPGMYLRHRGDNTIASASAPHPKRVEQGGHNNLQYLVKETDDYLAEAHSGFAFPWRCIIVAEEDRELPESDMVWLLAEPSRIEDVSWIKPGKVAWEWWNAWGLEGVDFQPGVNTRTYQYYIDFAAKYGIEYVILDEGWSVNGKADLMQVVPEIDLPLLCQYAESKGVGIVLWAGYAAMDRDMENVCRHYSEMGVKGFKVDFMDRDDQEAVRFYWRMAETAARYHLFVDFHGAYKPTGLNRTWPNVLNFEGVYGLENTKWDGATDFVTHECILPFTRMVAGPMDYTQGAMVCKPREEFRADWYHPMAQGTQGRQLAEYVIFDGPFSMLCDSPTNYEKYPELTRRIARIPTTWDETRVLEGRVGEYIVVERRKGDTWYVAGINNWTERQVVVYSDTITMEPGGGFLIVR